MEKHFICLANSYKHGGRCIGGIEVILENGNPVKLAHKKANKRILHKWIRPVCQDTDAIPNEEALCIKPFDLIKLTGYTECPENAQQENCFYSTMEVAESYDCNKRQELLNNIATLYNNYWIFGNKGKAVHPDKYIELDHSLILIKPMNVKFKLEPRPDTGILRPRVEFQMQDFNNITTTYDFPVTDPIFCQIVENNIEKANSFQNYYFTVSLGVEHDGWHSKLVAQVFYFNNE